MNMAGLYLQLLALFILTSIQCEISCPNEFSYTKQGVLKLMMGAMCPHTIQHGVVIMRTGKYQPEAKRQNVRVSNAVQSLCEIKSKYREPIYR